MTGSQIDITTSMLCSMIRNREWPRARSAPRSCPPDRQHQRTGSRPAAGSSSRMILGSAINTRASSNSFQLASPDRRAGLHRWRTRVKSAELDDLFRSLRGWLRSSAPTLPGTKPVCIQNRLSGLRASGTSMTVFQHRHFRGTAAGIWKGPRQPGGKTPGADAAPQLRLRPSSTSPASGFSSPAIVLNSVVLPAPFGPINPPMTPAGKSKDIPSTAVKPPNRLVISLIDKSALQF